MSDDKKAGGDLAAKPPPVTPEEVKVKVTPQEGGPATKPQIDKVTDQATKEVREAIREAAKGDPDTQRPKQLDAAKKAAKDVGDKLPRRAFKEVQVDIPNETPITAPATEGPEPPPPPPKPAPPKPQGKQPGPSRTPRKNAKL